MRRPGIDLQAFRQNASGVAKPQCLCRQPVVSGFVPGSFRHMRARRTADRAGGGCVVLAGGTFQDIREIGTGHADDIQRGRGPGHSAPVCWYSRERTRGAVGTSGQQPFMYIHSAGGCGGFLRIGCRQPTCSSVQRRKAAAVLPDSQTSRRDRAHFRVMAAAHPVLRPLPI